MKFLKSTSFWILLPLILLFIQAVIATIMFNDNPGAGFTWMALFAFAILEVVIFIFVNLLFYIIEFITKKTRNS
jgi:hypothetical protein